MSAQLASAGAEAPSSGARVRVSQNNAIIFEQNVPPGPFEFNELNPISSVGNLQVLVSEADGSEQRYLVPFSISAGKLNPGSYRYSVATGLYRNFSTTQDTQVLQGYVRYGINHLITPTVDVLAGPNYRNLGLQTSFNTSMGGISFNALFSHLYGITPKTGQAYGVNYVAPAWRNINLYAGTNYQTQFYTTPSSGLGIANNGSQVVFESFKRSDFVSLGIGLAELGSIG
jgi:outer membrane usher protein